MLPPLPLTRDLVLVGGGHAHALVLRMWGMKPVPGVRLTLVSPEPTAAYSGMLPGHVAGHYGRDELQIDLVRLARHAGARLVPGRVSALDPAARTVTVAGRPEIGWDILSIDIGITSDMDDLPGFAAHAVPAKPLDGFADRWQAFAAAPRPGAGVVVIGGGVAGVELALAAATRLGNASSVTLIEAGRALAAVGGGARRALLGHLKRLGVTLIEGVPVTAVLADAVHLGDGRQIAADFVIGAAATRPQAWLADTGLDLTQGFVTVDEHLRAPGDAMIFAAGDIAHMRHAPRPKAGVFAVRQAPVLLHNLTVAVTGQGRMKRYRPQGDYLKLVSAGPGHAVADKWGLPLDGSWLWHCKDRIDRRFMARFDALTAMPRPALPAVVAAGVAEELSSAKPMCGGCGAKVGRADLVRALAGLPAPRRSDVIWGAGDDAAILAHGAGAQVLTTDHMRAFTDDPWQLARIAAVHALGDVWSMGARPQVALCQVILPRMSPALQSRTLAEIMAAAAGVFGAEGADVVGGHTSLGAELTVGFTVTGLCDGVPVTQSGARPGDVLLLTKPIGTGVILAAEMARAAPGAVVAGALASMARPQGAVARALAPHARAMTDVTGFGLAGHLLGMLEASGVAATLDLAAVPVLPGALALAAAGHGSTLLPANRQSAARMFLTEGPQSDLLFDPQTAGGLLAAVPPEALEAVLAHLADIGESAAVIGRIEAGAPFVSVRD